MKRLVSGEREKVYMAGEETTLLKMSEEAYDDSIMSKAIDYSESANFECEISKFRLKYRCLFEDHISNLRNGSDDEQVSF